MNLSHTVNDAITSQPIRESLNAEQATTLIVERAKQLVNRLIEERGHDKPPFLPEELARLQGIKKIVKADLGETSAVLLRLHDGPVIKVNQRHIMTRQNFSCAHEIGHILFSELKLRGYIRSIEYRTFNPEGERGARAKAIERLCDAAATELLMPELVFGKYLSGFGVSIESVERLANIFRVSIQATARRIAEVSLQPCLALLWQPWPKSKPKGLGLSWCASPVGLSWCARPGRKLRDEAKYMPKHTLVEYPSSLHKADQHDGPVKSWRTFKVDNGVEKPLSIESKGFGRGDTRYVLSLAFLDR